MWPLIREVWSLTSCAIQLTVLVQVFGPPISRVGGPRVLAFLAPQLYPQGTGHTGIA